MLRTHFALSDGDHYPLHLSEVPAGGLESPTAGTICYGHDVGALLTGWRGAQPERVLFESGLGRGEGAF